MSPDKKSVLVLRMTVERALELGLIRCRCGHMENNHFDFESNPCAHCRCREYLNTPTYRVEILSHIEGKPSKDSEP